MLSKSDFQKCKKLSIQIDWWGAPNPDTQFKNLVRSIVTNKEDLDNICEYIAGCIFEETYPNPTYKNYVDIYVNGIYN